MAASFLETGQASSAERVQKNIETRKRVMLRNILFTAAVAAII
jgi:hypothetical protein